VLTHTRCHIITCTPHGRCDLDYYRTYVQAVTSVFFRNFTGRSARRRGLVRPRVSARAVRRLIRPRALRAEPVGWIAQGEGLRDNLLPQPAGGLPAPRRGVWCATYCVQMGNETHSPIPACHGAVPPFRATAVANDSVALVRQQTHALALGASAAICSPTREQNERTCRA